ncbi:ClbS/DfsB family four-helix bundle protein [Flagellimonas nanhaiensis]|uniref:DfsB family protein n=1 Tax=Flagellimonas nanhaiensis TaxID=2292706 RepID=A0A371JV66_9FLAO|nr:ClbS/DfsB family four-helix bundle protein [Allomuricauda nanhaiensis]RDY61709.1 DfsB family protein [Allomuricauda nanhaiensis]
MPRPKTKDELLTLGQKNYKKLNDFVDQYPLEEQLAEFSSNTMNRNIRDVLAHLHHWHLMVLDWCAVGMSGGKPDIPAKGYTWKTTPELNRLIWEKYNQADLQEVRKLLQESHEKVRAFIEKHSNDELFEKKRYKWTGTTSLGAYLISATSSHYDWALKIIKKGKK